MAVGALISAYQEDESGGLRALLPLAGRTLLDYQVRCAATAQQAMHSSDAQPVDVVILDDQVAGAHGFGHRLKLLQPGVVLLILSSVPLDPDASSYADGFAAKPDNPRWLLEKVSTLLRRVRRRAASAAAQRSGSEDAA